MSKERLEEIKKNIKMHMEWAKGTHYAEITEEELKDYEWLIQQAERVQELEEWRNEVTENVVARNAEYAKCREQNKRYREVIKKAIDDLENECLWDALVALKELEGEE